jgi:DNA mismatch repair ATPase MutS
MVEEPILKIQGGRHILYELCTDRYVTNDTMIGGGLDGDLSSMVSWMYQAWLRRAHEDR